MMITTLGQVPSLSSIVPVSDSVAAAQCDSFTCDSPGRVSAEGDLEVLVAITGVSGANYGYTDAGTVPPSILSNLGITVVPSTPTTGAGGATLTQAQTLTVLSAMEAAANLTPTTTTSSSSSGTNAAVVTGLQSSVAIGSLNIPVWGLLAACAVGLIVLGSEK